MPNYIVGMCKTWLEKNHIFHRDKVTQAGLPAKPSLRRFKPFIFPFSITTTGCEAGPDQRPQTAPCVFPATFAGQANTM